MSDLTLIERLRSDKLMIPTHEAADRIEELEAEVVKLKSAKPYASDQEIRIIFDGPPSHESGRFVEVENVEGCSISIGEWHARDDKLWELRIPNVMR